MQKRYRYIFIFGFVATFLLVSNVKFSGPLVSNNLPKSVGKNTSVFIEYGTPVKVARVIDGDTIELANGARIRYIGIDSPEDVKPDTPVQCFAKEAAERNKELVEGKEVTLQKDISVKDQYGRFLAFVYLADGTLVNKELVLEGDAFAYPFAPDVSKSVEFEQAQQYAKNNKLGLWTNCDVHILKGGREQTNVLH